MLPAPLRYAFLAAVIICNALFFWDVEFRADSMLSFAFGGPEAKHDYTRITQTRIQKSSTYTFSNPAQADRRDR